MNYERRATYFAFQGLLSAVLLLLFITRYGAVQGLGGRLAFLLAATLGTLVLLRLVPERTLGRFGFQTGLFLVDAALASLTLHWTEPVSELYLTYFLILFGTALARSLRLSLAVAGLTSILYLLSGWSPQHGFPVDTGFWLRFLFLWVTTLMLAILSQDSSNTQADQERRYQEKLIQVESLATLGQVAGEVAHRIKGPLTTIRVNAEVLAQRCAKADPALKELRQISEEVEHCKEILKHLLDLGRIEEMDTEEFDLREPLRAALRSIAPQAEVHGVRLEFEEPRSPLWIRGDSSLVHEAVLALLQNAVDALRAKARGKSRRVAVSVQAPLKRRWWALRRRRQHALRVADDGAGISPKDMPNIFKPFFTTKGPEGSGLGLSAALRIAQKHGGSLEAQSEGPGKGSVFTLRLPAASRRFR